MPLFDFSLRSLPDVAPWDRENTPRLHWFGLTDGTYSIEAGQSRLFQYTPQFLEYLATDPARGDCVDYYVIRLYEDLLQLLPDILQSIPIEAHLLISDVEKQRAWVERMRHIFEAAETPELENLHNEASMWFHYRQLDAGYLTQCPKIWFWRFDDQIFIRWDNEARQRDGIPVWTATAGEYSMPTEIFLAEVDSFHFRLMKGMSERIQEIRERNPIPHVQINLDELIQEHIKRKQSLARALAARPDKVDWAQTLAANEQLSKLRPD